MNIQEAKQEISSALRVYHRRDAAGRPLFPVLRQRPILLMGPPGIGKTAIMAQIAAEQEVGLVAYTMTHHTRQSAVGLPRIERQVFDGVERTVTEYTLSEIIASVYRCMERTGRREGILFIDEINCVSETLAPTMLQFLQNKTFGSHRVPDGWVIVAAGNPEIYNKSARPFDVVTLDRVRRLDVEADCGVWMDYARARGIHAAVLSYLTIRPEDFYRVDRETPSIVTARGWEDLSELIRGYEALDIPLTERQVGEYLQNRETARRFAGYYQLYRKYGTDYGVQDILRGDADRLAAAVEMAGAAAFDERMTVVNLTLDCLNTWFERYERRDGQIARLHEVLSNLKSFWRGRTDCEDLREFIEGQRRSLQEKKRAELPADEVREAWVLDRLERYAVSLFGAHIHDAETAFLFLRDLFERDAAERAALVEEISGQLDRAFDFLERCFGEGQELVQFVSVLTRTERAMAFITRHGSAPYLRWSQALLYREREQELQAACADLLSRGTGTGEEDF